MFARLHCWTSGHVDQHVYNLGATRRHPARSEWRCSRCKRIELRAGHWPEPTVPLRPMKTLVIGADVPELPEGADDVTLA